MIILDFIKGNRIINGKRIGKRYIIREIDIKSETRPCFTTEYFRDIHRLYKISYNDMLTKSAESIGCSRWTYGINCLLDPSCSKGECVANENDILKVLLNAEDTTEPKVVLLVNIPANLAISNSNRTIAYKIMKHIDPEIKNIYQEYLAKTK